MKPETLSRLIAAALMVVIIAAAINIDHLRRCRMGREAFMDYQGLRYSRYFAQPNLEQPLVESILLCVTFVLIYELIASNTFKILTFIGDTKSRPHGPPPH